MFFFIVSFTAVFLYHGLSVSALCLSPFLMCLSILNCGFVPCLLHACEILPKINNLVNPELIHWIPCSCIDCLIRIIPDIEISRLLFCFYICLSFIPFLLMIHISSKWVSISIRFHVFAHLVLKCLHYGCCWACE